MIKREKNRQVRVCFVRHQIYPAVPTARNAEALVSHGYGADILCLKEKGKKSHEVIGGVNVYRLPLQHRRGSLLGYVFEYFASFFLFSWILLWMFPKRRYRVVEVDNMPDILVFSALLLKLMGVKIVLTVLDHMPGVYADGAKVSPKHPVVRMLGFLEWASATFADHVIVTQSASKEILERRGIPASKISVVLNTPDENIFKPRATATNNNGHFRLITHGTLVERYGVQTLIKAIPLLLKEIPGLEVKILGEGEYRPNLEKLAQSLGVQRYVTFTTGWLPLDEIPPHIAQADVGIVVIPSGMNPAMPNKLLEYLALGKPVIATFLPAIKAYFNDDSIIFYEPDNERDLARCILDLYHNPRKREVMAALSTVNYQKFRWSVVKHEYFKVFDQLVKPLNLLLPEEKQAYSRLK